MNSNTALLPSRTRPLLYALMPLLLAVPGLCVGAQDNQPEKANQRDPAQQSPAKGTAKAPQQTSSLLGYPEPPPPPGKPAAGIEEMTHAPYLEALAVVHLRFGAHDRARAALEKALAAAEKEADKLRLHQWLGGLHRDRHEWAAAARHFEQALEHTAQASQRAGLALTLAELYVRAKQFEKAEKLLHELLHRAPSPDAEKNAVWGTSLALLVQIWRGQEGRLEQAVAELEAEAEKHPDDEAALERLTMVYSMVPSDPESQVAVVKKLARLRPAEVALHQRLAQLYRKAKRPEKAIETYKELSQGADATRAPYYVYQAALLMLEAGKKKEALEWARKQLSGEASGVGKVGEAKNVEQRLKESDERTDVGENDKGESKARIEKGTRQVSANLAMLSALYDKAGQPEQAEAVLYQALASSRNDVERGNYHLRIAYALRKRKAYDKAKEHVSHALILGATAKNKDLNVRGKNALLRLQKEQEDNVR